MIRSYVAGFTIDAQACVDLQTHTHLSDGQWTPQALLDYFVAEGFAVAAITDHDRVDTMQDIQRMAHERGFPLLVATEMTTRWRDSIVDILCFGFEHHPTPLNALCQSVYQAQSDVSRQVYHGLVTQGYLPQHNADELESILQATTSRQPNLLYECFVRYNPTLADDIGPMKAAGYKLCTNPTLAVVEAAHLSGGVALIAHPGRTDGFITFDAPLFDAFRAEIPIDGIEVYYPRHTPEQTRLYQAYADQYGLLVSAGSDSHTPANPPIKYRADLCRALLDWLEIKVV